MPGMQFEYDEKGGTFYYFLLSFMALVLIPATYFLWPTKEEKEDQSKQKKECQCEPCQLKKQRIKAGQPWHRLKHRAIKAGLIIGWILFILVVYKASQVEIDFTEFDPFAELGIDRGASNAEIKKAYRRLSLLYHPDKETGDPQKFMRITKAHQALTDEEAKKNWEEYGNPDGPGATHLGIALPKWIVEKQNSVWVLLVYGLVFMVLLPVVVGTWWYRSIKYSAEQILMDTTQLYFYFFHKTPHMILRRVLMILGGSMEFEKGHNGEVAERPSDNEEIPMLMRDLPNLQEKNKEKPLCYPYSVKARALLHAHFSRLELPPKTLELDKQYVLKKCPYLINEMISIVAQLVAMAHAGRVQRMPRLDTVESIMKISQMVVQALWDNKSVMLQLPHVSEDMLRHFTTKRRNVRSIKELVLMKDEDRQAMLRSLSDLEYRNLINVLANLPLVTMQVTSEVLDDEDKSITAGSIVTVTVKLTRENMEVLMSDDLVGGAESTAAEQGVEEVETEQGTAEEKEEESQNAVESPARKPKVWEKQQKKKKGAKGGKPGGKKNAKVKAAPVYVVKKTPNNAPATPGGEKKEEEEGGGDTKQDTTPNGTVPKAKRSERRKRDNSGSTDDESAPESEDELDADDGDKENVEGKGEEPVEEEDDWEKFQEESKKDNVLETKSKETHLVHCPYFPAEKHEWWWVYVADRKSHLLITAPVQVCSLKTEEQVQLKFSAPSKPGVFQYTVVLRSDSYMDFDQAHSFKLDVKEAKKIESHPQWDMSEEEEEDKDDEEATDSEDYDSEDDSAEN